MSAPSTVLVVALVVLALVDRAVAPPVACCSANLQPGCTRNSTIETAVIQSSPACITSWSASCVDLTKSLFPSWCPVPPIDCQATCDYLGPDGVQCFWEACDDGNTLNTDACTNVCELAVCGDGFVRTGVEVCDDGNTIATDACTATCQVARCGDGVVRAGIEACDDGNLDSSDFCLTSCVVATCGDGVLNTAVGSTEQCDSGSFSLGGSCLPGCVLATCGDGYLQTGVEECDDGAANSDVRPNACRTSCKRASCGDGVVDSSNSEVCDAGPSAVVTSSCCVGCQHSFSDCTSCVNATHASLGTCLQGGCVASRAVTCAPFACDASAGVCLTACANDQQCSSGYVCAASTCVRDDAAQFRRADGPAVQRSAVSPYAFLVGGVIFLTCLFTLLVVLAFVRGTIARWRERYAARGAASDEGDKLVAHKNGSSSVIELETDSSYSAATSTRWD